LTRNKDDINTSLSKTETSDTSSEKDISSASLPAVKTAKRHRQTPSADLGAILDVLDENEEDENSGDQKTSSKVHDQTRDLEPPPTQTVVAEAEHKLPEIPTEPGKVAEEATDTKVEEVQIMDEPSVNAAEKATATELVQEPEPAPESEVSKEEDNTQIADVISEVESNAESEDFVRIDNDEESSGRSPIKEEGTAIQSSSNFKETKEEL